MKRQDGLKVHDGNGMIESAYITDKRERREEPDELDMALDDGDFFEAAVEITIRNSKEYVEKRRKE